MASEEVIIIDSDSSQDELECVEVKKFKPDPECIEETSDDSLDGSICDRDFELYNDLPCLRIDKPLTSVEALDLLINLKPGDKHVCSKKPVAVKNAATFVVDTGKLVNVEDLKADEMGAWCHKGMPTRKFRTKRSPSGVVYGAQKTEEDGTDTFELIRVYYHHKSTPVFRRTLFYAHGTLYTSVCVQTEIIVHFSVEFFIDIFLFRFQ